MRINQWVFIICTLICLPAKSQVAQEVQQLENIVRNYFDKSRDVFELEAIGNLSGPSEAFFITLEIDSAGGVDAIHLFSENNKDSAYVIFINLKASDFNSWKGEKYKGKTILIPVVVLNRTNKPDYVYNMADMTPQRREVRRIIIAKTVVLSWPYIIRDESIQSITIPIDSLPKIRSSISR